ncbi:MAG TPA: U32 family peptidase [Thermoanaerobacterales bacterium]|nr:U32 family peptidase [Thermoanaerobacterales bacterium]
MLKPELLAPAGNLEKLKTAILYGADAVYIGGTKYGLRAFADNFSWDEMGEAINFAQKHNAKIYTTVNIFFHNEDLKGLATYIKRLNNMGVNGIIVSDPGVIMLAKEVTPSLEVHLSTQANTTNWVSALYWYKQGIKRIILARELSLTEIKEIREKSPSDLKIEVFVHGAMCISYSGRCLISNYMSFRDANRGECTQPCRWKYYLTEEKRPGEYLPVFENDKGTYIFNSKDLCTIHKLPELIKAGVNSFKIEGRMKSVHYVASVVSAYRKAIDQYFEDPDNYKFNPKLLDNIKKASHREFTTGFYFGKPGKDEQTYESSGYIREYDFVGLVKEYKEEKKVAIIEQRNHFKKGDEVEFFSPNGKSFDQQIIKMWDESGEEIHEAPHPQQMIALKTEHSVKPFTIMRRKNR